MTKSMVEAQVTFRPLGDRMLVERAPEAGERVSEKSGLITKLAVHAEAPAEGVVLAVGNGRVTDDGREIPVAVKAGERVAFGKYAGTTIVLDGDEFLILREADVLGVIE